MVGGRDTTLGSRCTFKVSCYRISNNGIVARTFVTTPRLIFSSNLAAATYADFVLCRSR